MRDTVREALKDSTTSGAALETIYVIGAPEPAVVARPLPDTATANDRPAPPRPPATGLPPRTVHQRGWLVLGALGVLGLVAFSASVIALPAILAIGTTLTVLFAAGGAALLVGRKLGKIFRKQQNR